MISKEEKENQLLQSGIFTSVKTIFQNQNVYIPDKYLMLIADYIDALNQLDPNDGLFLNPVDVAKKLPFLLKRVYEEPLGVHGITDNYTIKMNSNNDYQTNKLFFFHELTHVIQTRMINGKEECSFYNGDTGMFLAEGATQFTAEILYNLSNNTQITYREQPNSVRGLNNHTPYSALSQYQLNGNIIMLMSYSLGIPLNQILALGYRTDGRNYIKGIYESLPGNEGKFEEFMLDLEKIYSIDKVLMTPNAYRMNNSVPTNLIMMNKKTVFPGNIQIENELINKVERELAAIFIANYDEKYIIENYKNMALYFTTPEIKNDFLNTVQQIIDMSNQDVDDPSLHI